MAPAQLSDQLPVDTPLAQSTVARKLSPAIPKKQIDNLADDNNEFAFDLYQHLRQQQSGNFFYSPYSISAALAMIFAGARGDTEAQMAQTLHFGLGQDALHPAFNAMDLSLKSAEVESGADLRHLSLRAANSLWAQQDYRFLPAFLDILARYYGTGLHLVDYTDDSRREQTRQAINAWVSRETERKITQVIAPGVLDAMTRLVVANAIYFKGEWAVPFEPDSPEAPFHRLDGSQVRARLMFRIKETACDIRPDCEVAQLDYRGDRLSLVLLLPSVDEFAGFERSLTAAKMRGILTRLGGRARLYLPRFRFDTSLSLAGTLAALGMPLAFDAARADFSGATSQRDLFVSEVIHKAFVAVDEQGTEAAAATTVMSPTAALRPQQPAVIRADHPFIILIRERLTGSILFVGRVLDPLNG